MKKIIIPTIILLAGIGIMFKYSQPSFGGASIISVSQGGTGWGYPGGIRSGYLMFGRGCCGDSTSIGTSTNLFWDNTNSRFGVGSTSPVSSLVVVGGILGTETKPATSTSMTLDFSTYNQHLIQIGTSATTLTLSGLFAGQATRVVVCNPNATASTISWATSPAGLLLWPGGTVPTQTVTANKCDVYTFTVTQATSTTGSVRVLGGYVQNF